MRTVVGDMEQEIKGRIPSFLLMYGLVPRSPLFARNANLTGYIERRKTKRVTVGKTTIIKGVGLL
jgi:hypothetical protein